MTAAGLIPAGLEMMDQAAARAVEPFVNAGYDLDAALFLRIVGRKHSEAPALRESVR